MDFSGFEDVLSDFERTDESEKSKVETTKQDKNIDNNNTNNIFGDVENLKNKVFNSNEQFNIKQNNNKKDKINQLHSGHRQRARERFLLNPEEVSDYDLLELLLFLIIPRADTKPMAKMLIDKYKNLRNVFNANVEELNNIGVNGNSLKYLFTLTNIFQKRCLKQELNNLNIIDNIDKLFEYCKTSIGSLKHEEMHILFFDVKFHLIEDKKIGDDDDCSVLFNIKEILQKCISLKSSCIVLYHNHPSGDIAPSIEDIENTNKIVETLQNIDVEVIDHVIVGGEQCFSLKQNDLF